MSGSEGRRWVMWMWEVGTSRSRGWEVVTWMWEVGGGDVGVGGGHIHG